MLEDVSAVFSLEELKQIFHSVVENYKKVSNDMYNAPSWNEHDFVSNLQEHTKRLYPKLHAKYTLYNASIFRRMLKLLKSVDMTCDNVLFRQISKAVKDPSTPDFDQIFWTESFDYHVEKLSFEEMMEKQILLKYLFGTDFMDYLNCG